jgi:hypothetical protein
MTRRRQVASSAPASSPGSDFVESVAMSNRSGHLHTSGNFDMFKSCQQRAARREGQFILSRFLRHRSGISAGSRCCIRLSTSSLLPVFVSTSSNRVLSTNDMLSLLLYFFISYTTTTTAATTTTRNHLS